MHIEPLEARIAPAAVLTYTDVDGDAVTITISKGTAAQAALLIQTSPAGFFTTINLQGDHDFDGADITVTAKPKLTGGVLRGDEHADVSFIDATDIPLGAVKIAGDLGKLVAGDGVAPFGVKTLTVASLGARGIGGSVTDLQTNIAGQLGSAKIAGDLEGYLYASKGIGSVSVGGDLIGGAVDYTGGIYTAENLGPVTVKGNVIGGSGGYTGAIGAGHEVGNVTIGGSLLGNSGDNSGKIYSGFIPSMEPGAYDMGAIKIGRDVVGGKSTPGNPGQNSGVIFSPGAIASVTIGGSMRGNNGVASGRIEAVGDIGAVQIVGSVLGESGGAGGGAIFSGGQIKLVKIGGSLVGGEEDESGTIFADVIQNLSIGGDLAGGLGNSSGRLRADTFGTVAIAGSISGGSDPDPSDMVTVAGDSGSIRALMNITKLTVGGSLEGTNGGYTARITVGGDLGSLAVGGDLRGGEFAGSTGSGSITVSGKIGTATIQGSLIGGAGSIQTAYINGDKGIAKITVGGSVFGGNFASYSGVISAANGTLGSVSIAGDLVGGYKISGGTFTDSGAILAQRLGNVTIGGSIYSGPGIARSGAIISDQDIGALVVKGSLVGKDLTTTVNIYAGSLAGDPVEKNLAIKSLTIGGRVEYARIFAGVDHNGDNVTGNAQIGPVKVGGAWIASLLVTGVNAGTGAGELGDNTDVAVNPNGKAKIASVVIGGPVLGRLGSPDDTFGFIAREIGSFKYQGIAVALTKGAGNDTFALGKAHAVGPSLTNRAAVPDGFAVHVFEV